MEQGPTSSPGGGWELSEKRAELALWSPGHRKQQQQQWQQQRQAKTPTKKQEAKKKSKSDPGSQRTSLKRFGAMVSDPWPGHRSLPDLESDKKQLLQTKRKGPTLKQAPTERPQVGNVENFQDYLPSKQNPKLSKREPTNEDISRQMEVVWEAQESTPKDLSASTSVTSWNSELKLLRILQATDYEDEDSQPCGTQSKESPEA